MRDSLADFVCAPVTPLRKCEWCLRPAERGGDLCKWDLEAFVNGLKVPVESGPYEAEVVLSILRAAGGVTLP